MFLQEGLSKFEFYIDLFYKFRKSVVKTVFVFFFRKNLKNNNKNNVIRCKKHSNNMGILRLRHTACMVVNSFVAETVSFFFNCTTVGRFSD